MKIYLVSEAGLQQIESWIRSNYHDHNIPYMDAVGMARFVGAYASEAESSVDHLAEIPARLSKTGQPITMAPDMYSIEIEGEAC